MFFATITNPEVFRVYMPLILQHVLFLMALVIFGYKYLKLVSWKEAFRKTIANRKAIITWVVIFVAAVALPTVMLNLMNIAINLISLALIVKWITVQFQDPNSYLGSHIYDLIATKQKWEEVFYFWKSLLANPLRVAAMAVIVATESDILGMVISIAILIGISYGVNHFYELNKLNWNDDTTQKVATVLVGAIAVIKFLLRLGIPVWLIAVIVAVIAVLVGIKMSKDDISE